MTHLPTGTKSPARQRETPPQPTPLSELSDAALEQADSLADGGHPFISFRLALRALVLDPDNIDAMLFAVPLVSEAGEQLDVLRAIVSRAAALLGPKDPLGRKPASTSLARTRPFHARSHGRMGSDSLEVPRG